MGNIYKKARAKLTFATVIISLIIVVVLWGCLLITDYIMFTKGNPTIYSTKTIVDKIDGHETYEEGICYTVVINESNEKIFYLFGKEIDRK